MAAVLQSRPVGSLACQKDSYLRTLEATVLSCTKLTQPPEKSRVSKKTLEKAEDDSATKEKEVWQIEFSDSVLFPEGTTGRVSTTKVDHLAD